MLLLPRTRDPPPRRLWSCSLNVTRVYPRRFRAASLRTKRATRRSALLGAQDLGRARWLAFLQGKEGRTPEDTSGGGVRGLAALLVRWGLGRGLLAVSVWESFLARGARWLGRCWEQLAPSRGERTRGEKRHEATSRSFHEGRGRHEAAVKSIRCRRSRGRRRLFGVWRCLRSKSWRFPSGSRFGRCRRLSRLVRRGNR